MLKRVSMRTLGLMLSAGAFTVLGAADGDGFEREELFCEQAVAHLSDCCPDFDKAAVSCRHYFDCDSGERHADIDAATASCIKGASCDALRALGVCDQPARGLSCEP